MTTLIKDFQNGTPLCYIGITGCPSPISNMQETQNGFSISCDGGQYFTVTADKIFYSNVI